MWGISEHATACVFLSMFYERVVVTCCIWLILRSETSKPGNRFSTAPSCRVSEYGLRTTMRTLGLLAPSAPSCTAAAPLLLGRASSLLLGRARRLRVLHRQALRHSHALHSRHGSSPTVCGVCLLRLEGRWVATQKKKLIVGLGLLGGRLINDRKCSKCSSFPLVSSGT